MNDFDVFGNPKEMNCQQIQDRLEDYVFGALDPEDHAGFEHHLKHCSNCQRIFEQYQEVIHQLPHALAAASRLEAPHSMKTRLMESIVAEASKARQRRARFPNGRPASWLRSLFSLRFVTWSRLSPVFVMVILVVAILSLAWNARLSVALAKERSLRAEFANLVDQQELVLEVIDSDQTSRAILRPVDQDSRSYGKLFIRADMPHVVVMAALLPQPPQGQSYHLWVSYGEELQHTGVLQLNEDGFGLLLFDADQPGPAYESVQITLQPPDQIRDPGKPILQWRHDK
jgi:anti-sigma-K factor RskA